MKALGYRVVAVALVLGAVCGCADPREASVREGVARAARMLNTVNRSEIARLSFASIVQMGGSPASYVAANTRDGADLPPLLYEAPAEPWSVVIRQGDAPGEFIVEGYGAETDEALLSERVTVGPLPQM